MRARNSGACSGMNNGATSYHAESPIVAIQHHATEDAFNQLGVDFSNASLYLAGIQRFSAFRAALSFRYSRAGLCR